MPKVKVIFKLPEEQEKFEQYVRSTEMAIVLWEFNSNVKRFLVKNKDVSEDYLKGVDDCFEKFYELLEEYSLNVDKLCS